VLGVLPGIVGSLQASQAIQWLAGIGEPLVGRLLVFDALATRFREVRIPKSPDCPVCSEHPTQTGLVRYDEVCATEEEGDELEPAELARRLAAGEPLEIVDVRLAHEVEIAPFPGARWIPLHELDTRSEEIPRDRTVVTLCHVGQRSAVAADFLRRHGWPRVLNLAGGLDAWSRHVDPALPRS
jgi:rhodanese-related sulfurtransferase